MVLEELVEIVVDVEVELEVEVVEELVVEVVEVDVEVVDDEPTVLDVVVVGLPLFSRRFGISARKTTVEETGRPARRRVLQVNEPMRCVPP